MAGFGKRPVRAPLGRAALAALGAACSLACAGLSLGPNEGSGVDATPAVRRALGGAGEPAVQLQSHGGRILRAPTVRLVAPAASARAERLQAFLQAWSRSPAYGEQLDEYGVAPLSVAAPWPSSYAWPASSFDADRPVADDLQSNVEAALAEAYQGAGQPALEDDLVLVVLVPDGVSVSLTGEPVPSTCRGQALSWHAATRWLGDGRAVPYVGVSSCAGAFGLTADETASVALSHGLLDAITNPFGNGLVGASPGSAWSMLPGPQEAASLCAAAAAGPADLFARPAGLPLPLSRSWSNANSAAGLSPCVPAAHERALGASVGGTEAIEVTDRRTGRVRQVRGVGLAEAEVALLPVAVDGATAGEPARLTAEVLAPGGLSASVEAGAAASDPHALRLAWLPGAQVAEVLVRLSLCQAERTAQAYLLVSRRR